MSAQAQRATGERPPRVTQLRAPHGLLMRIGM